MKREIIGILLSCGFLSAIGQNWSTIGGSSSHNGLSHSFGPESIASPFWSITNAAYSQSGQSICTCGEYFATSRVIYTGQDYYAIAECRMISDGSLVWSKQFPDNGKPFVVGMTEDAVYVYSFVPNDTCLLYAFDMISGEQKWVCPEDIGDFLPGKGMLFTCTGDPIVQGPDFYAKSLMRLDKNTGAVLWYNTNYDYYPGSFCVVGDRTYRWGGPEYSHSNRLVAVDNETGENLFSSDELPGGQQQNYPLTAGPDGTIYGQRYYGDLYAFTDEGSSFSIKWTHTPTDGQTIWWGNTGIGPDGSVYFPEGHFIKRLDPSTGQVLGTSEALCTGYDFMTFIVVDGEGKVFASNEGESDGKYFCFSPDLQTKLWECSMFWNSRAAPQISKDGILLMTGQGTFITAYKTGLPHRPVSWFEADHTMIQQNSDVNFTDMSSFLPVSWHWIFEGGIPSESFEQNPVPVFYPDPGLFPVTLITTNALGTDTLVRECYISVDPGPGFKFLALKIFLEGLYNNDSGQMNQAQNASGPQFGAGIADQVTIELHNAVNYNIIEYSTGPVDLSTTGDISIPTIPSVFDSSYWITVKHRNSIETSSASEISFAGDSISYDFTVAASMAYGNNLKETGIVYSVWGGDANQDGIVDGADILLIFNASQLPLLTGYNSEDLNGDGIVDGGDISLIYNHSLPPTRQAVLP